MDNLELNKITRQYKKSLIIKDRVRSRYSNNIFGGYCVRTSSYFISYFNCRWNIIGFINYVYNSKGDGSSSVVSGLDLSSGIRYLFKSNVLLLSRESSFKRI